MIVRTNILSNLKALDRNYKKAGTLRESLFYSKLAVLELCGWIEESMDDVVLRCARRNLKYSASLKFIEEQVVKRTYGFQYDEHFRRMLIQLIGVVNVERIGKSVDQTKKARLLSALGTLKAVRNAEAHTHIKGVTRHIDAPSVSLGRFPALDGLIEFEATLRRTKF